jgi:hypothetical protein
MGHQRRFEAVAALSALHSISDPEHPSARTFRPAESNSLDGMRISRSGLLANLCRRWLLRLRVYRSGCSQDVSSDPLARIKYDP